MYPIFSGVFFVYWILIVQFHNHGVETFKSIPPPCISNFSPKYFLLIAVHSICHPGKPDPHGDGHFIMCENHQPFPKCKILWILFFIRNHLNFESYLAFHQLLFHCFYPVIFFVKKFLSQNKPNHFSRKHTQI